MKQEIINNINSCSQEVFQLSQYLYENYETSYKEYNACNKITSLLKEKDFNVKDNFLNITTAFEATYGSGYPKICTVCEYDAVEGLGHITGHNMLTAISLLTALGLKEILNKTRGSITILGCPGEYLGGAKVTMTKQGIFDDVDAVLMAHPDIETSESGTSSAILPLSAKFLGNDGLSFLNKGSYTSLDAALLTFNILNSLIKGFPKDVNIDGVLSKGGITPLIIPKETEIKFYVRGKDMNIASEAQDKLNEIIKFTEKILKVKSDICLYEPPYDELITNITLSRLFSHNLKECGIIEIEPPRDIYAGLSLGTVSHKTPCIHPYIGITENQDIKYGTLEFASATLTNYAKDQAVKAASALAITALDLIESDNLLSEVKTEFYDVTK